MTKHLIRWPITSFLLITFVTSLLSGFVAFAIAGAQTFESPRVLPLLLLTIWSPNIAAYLVTSAEGQQMSLMRSICGRGSLGSWLLALTPLGLSAIFFQIGEAKTDLPSTTWLAVILLNLIMGPLGEEFGWRAFLLPRWAAKWGLIKASFTLGVVWALWHLLLWFLPSPHREIPYGVFMLTVISFSLILSAIWRLGSGSLGPAILFHLATNVGVAWLELSGVMNAEHVYLQALPYYALLALMSAGWILISETSERKQRRVLTPNVVHHSHTSSRPLSSLTIERTRNKKTR